MQVELDFLKVSVVIDYGQGVIVQPEGDVALHLWFEVLEDIPTVAVFCVEEGEQFPQEVEFGFGVAIPRCL